MATQHTCDECGIQVSHRYAFEVQVTYPRRVDTYGAGRSEFEFCSKTCAARWMAKEATVAPPVAEQSQKRPWWDWR